MCTPFGRAKVNEGRNRLLYEYRYYIFSFSVCSFFFLSMYLRAIHNINLKGVIAQMFKLTRQFLLCYIYNFIFYICGKYVLAKHGKNISNFLKNV